MFAAFVNQATKVESMKVIFGRVQRKGSLSEFDLIQA
jgi:hypothetical protein